jgi:hypothetical protein
MTLTDTATKLAIGLPPVAPVVTMTPALKSPETPKPGETEDGLPEFLRAKQFHPLADEFPWMEGEEFKALVEDIRTNGLLESIVMFEQKILDGRNRWRAARLAGYTFKETDFVELPKGVDPTLYVISKNIRRRHISPEERRKIIVKLLKLNPEASDRQIGIVTGVDHKTVGAVRAETEATGEIPQLEKRTGRDGKKRKSKSKPKSKAVTPSSTQLSDDADKYLEKLVEILDAMSAKARVATATDAIRRLMKDFDISIEDVEEEESEEEDDDDDNDNED